MAYLRLEEYLLAGAALIVAAGTAFAQPPTSDPVERSMYFVERSSQATELVNSNQPQQAYLIFQELVASYADLDTEGYAATGIGDCLLAMDRTDQARQAYQAALAAHPDLRDSIERKLAEIDLAGDISDELVLRLRAAALTPGEGQYAAKWRLARALQKRAKALLTEAVAALRATVESDSVDARFLQSTIGPHTAVLESIINDLGSLIASSEGLRLFKPGLQTPADQPKTITERRRMEQTIRTADGRRFQIEMRRDSEKGPGTVTINGRPLELNLAQKRLLARYQDQINALLVEAADQVSSEKAAQR